MEPMRVRELLAATGGTLIGDQVDLDTAVTAVETDSRAVGAGALFVALRGEQTDGHRYIPNALAAGAAGCLTEEPPQSPVPGKFYIQVPSTLEAIGQVAKAYKEKFPIPVIGVTGSVGKTTTKDMIASVLGVKYRVLKTEGNYNNELGLPLTLFRLTPEHQICVLEMGMSALGEIDYLTGIAAPDVGVVTNVGDAHIENLGSRENILKAKLEIFGRMQADGLAVLCGDDAMLRSVEGKLPMPTVYCGREGQPPYAASDLQQLGAWGMQCTVRTPKTAFDVTIPALGNHMIYPVLMACAIGERFGLTGPEMKQGIEAFVPTKMRMNVVRQGAVTILDDAYNANPQSMRAGLEVLAQSGGESRVAVLGDMFELGALGPELHRGVGEFAGSLENIDAVLAVGELAWHLYDAACQSNIPDVIYAKDKEEAKAFLPGLVKPGAVILLKASRGMAFEELVACVKDLAAQ